VKADAAIGFEMAAGYAHGAGIVVDGVERRCVIHSGQQPGSSVASAGTELEEAAAGLRRGENRK
jgi:hypothetical protein